MADKVRIGIIGAGGIFRSRHFPGLAKVDDAEVVAVCNRSEESGRKISEEFGLSPDIMIDPHALIARDDIDAVMIGTWPYLHCPLVLEALDAGKHAFVQARMAMDYAEARRMHARAEESDRVVQICPPPHCLRGDWFVRRLISEGYLGEVYNIYVRCTNGELIDPDGALTWRQKQRFSGINTLRLGMLVEYVHRWFGYASSVTAQAKTYTKERPTDGGKGPVERPDTVNILAEMESGALTTYAFSGLSQMTHPGCIEAYGSEGALIYYLGSHKILGGKTGDDEMKELTVPENEVREWTVEQDFVDAIQGRFEGDPESTFYQGVKYMEFTEAVFRSVEDRNTVHLPLGG